MRGATRPRRCAVSCPRRFASRFVYSKRPSEEYFRSASSYYSDAVHSARTCVWRSPGAIHTVIVGNINADTSVPALFSGRIAIECSLDFKVGLAGNSMKQSLFMLALFISLTVPALGAGAGRPCPRVGCT